MNNEELYLKLNEIMQIENTFDAILALKEFEKSYKNSEFFKQTKMSVKEVVEYYKTLNPINILSLKNDLQKLVNEIDFDNFMGMFDKMADVFAKENQDIQDNIGLVAEYAKLGR